MLVFDTPPLLILLIGVVVILGLIIGLRANAFLALIVAAMVVSLLAPGAVGEKMTRVAAAFGGAAGNIAIVIALAAIIGQCMMDSGAADRIVRSFLRALGEKRAGVALLGSGYVLAIPVFFDTVFYLLVPLARSLFRRTRKDYILYIMAIAAGGAVTHTLVPPTPGPLVMAAQLKIDIGIMIMIGALIALPASAAGLLTARVLNRLMPIAPEGIALDEPAVKAPGPVVAAHAPSAAGAESVTTTPEESVTAADPVGLPADDSHLPGLGVSVLPIVLPVLLISLNTILVTWAKGSPDQGVQQAAALSGVFGNANFALLVSALVAMALLVKQRGLSLVELGKVVELSLMSGGVIILITAAGGAFGAMLKEAQIGPAVQGLFSSQGEKATGMLLLLLGFGVASVLKVAQGSSTVAMITGSAMLADLVGSGSTLGFHPVYLATAIGSGSLVGSWMNDSGFWVVSKMSDLTEVQTLKTWTVLLVVLGLVGFAFSVLLAVVIPFPLGSGA